MHVKVIIFPHIHHQFDLDRRFFPFVEFMSSCMITSYRLLVTQVNEKPPWESSLDLIFTQHAHDENPKPRKVRPYLEIEPLRAWYYRISSNFHTLMILLQFESTFNDGYKTITKVFTKLKTFLSLHDLQFPMLDTIVGSIVQFVDSLLIVKRIT